jgi:drug/metabolite transporter (DMT)-like permease
LAYLASLRHISPSDASMAATTEPVTAAVASLTLLGVALVPLQYAGGAAILGAVVLLRRMPS